MHKFQFQSVRRHTSLTEFRIRYSSQWLYTDRAFDRDGDSGIAGVSDRATIAGQQAEG